jgi:Protein of unknown function (DUF3224)
MNRLRTVLTICHNRIFALRRALILTAGLIFVPALSAQIYQAVPVRKEAHMSHATGPFDVKLTPQDDKLDPSLARMIIDKQFHGDLEGTSKGTMLSAGTAVKGSAGYVAIELVSGTLHGRTGTFVLQHSATMNRGVPSLSISVVPDSGTGQLTGLTGTMNIIIADGKHSYDFSYSLPEKP